MRSIYMAILILLCSSELMSQSIKEYRGYSTLTSATDTIADSMVSVIMRYDSSGKLYESYVIEYDSNLNRTDSILTRYNQNGDVTLVKSAKSLVEYTYDDKGSINTIDYDSKENKHTITYISHYNWLGLLNYQTQVDEHGISNMRRNYTHFFRYERVSTILGIDAKSVSVYRYHWLTKEPVYVKHHHEFYGSSQKSQFYFKRKWNGKIKRYYELFNGKPAKKIITKYKKGVMTEKLEYNYEQGFDRLVQFEAIYY